MKQFFSTCPRDCYDTCSIITTIDDYGRIASLMGNRDHPITKGLLCPKGYNLIKYVYHEDRLLYPLRRVGKKGSGDFEKISWDEALEEITDKMKYVIKKYGPEAILHYDFEGHTGLISTYFPRRFFNVIGSSETTYSICDAAGELAIALHYGMRYGQDPKDMLKSDFIVFWGFNAAFSNLHNFILAKAAKNKGATIYVIDPIATETTKLGTHIRIEPGTDGHFALGVANYLIEHDLINRYFIERFTSGFDDFAKYVRKYSLHKVSKITKVPIDKIILFAEKYANSRSSLINIGYGLQKQKNGGEIVRAIVLLPALVGVPRGFFFCNSERDINYRYLTAAHLRKNSPVKYVMQQLGRVLNSGKIKFLFVYNANPAATAPNQKLVLKGLKRKDLFVVVHDLFLTDTALYADIVLPATSFFETNDIHISFWHYYISLNQQAIEPIGESKSNSELFRLLAKKMNLPHPELYEEDKTIIKRLLELTESIEGTFDDLMKKGFLRMKQRPLKEFQTPSGKIEFASTKAKQLGLNEFPSFADEKRKYPLRLISSSHKLFLHSQYYNINQKEPYCLIHPIDAKRKNINDETYIVVYNERGSITLKAKISDKVMPGVIWTFRSPWITMSKECKNVNILTNDGFQSINYGSIFNSTFVDIKRA